MAFSDAGKLFNLLGNTKDKDELSKAGIYKITCGDVVKVYDKRNEKYGNASNSTLFYSKVQINKNSQLLK